VATSTSSFRLCAHARTDVPVNETQHFGSPQQPHGINVKEQHAQAWYDKQWKFVLLKLAQPKLDMPTTHIVHRDGPGGQD